MHIISFKYIDLLNSNTGQTVKKIFFSVVFSLMISSSVEAMTGSKALLNALKIQGSRLSALQSHYLAQGKAAFLNDLSKGAIPAQDVQGIARIFTRKSCVQTETYIRVFSERVKNMQEIQNAVSAHTGYSELVNQLGEEMVEDSFDFAKIAIDIDPSVVRAVVDQVPSVLHKQGFYWHGYGTREGTLLDYVEDEICETLDTDQLTRLNTVKNDLLERGAKRLRELHAQASS